MTEISNMKSVAIMHKISKRIASSPRGVAPTIPGVFQYNIKADDGVVYAFIMDLKNLKTGYTTTEKVDVTFDLSDDDFVLLESKTLSYQDAITQGKMTVSGNMDLAEKLFAASAVAK